MEGLAAGWRAIPTLASSLTAALTPMLRSPRRRSTSAATSSFSATVVRMRSHRHRCEMPDHLFRGRDA